MTLTQPALTESITDFTLLANASDAVTCKPYNSKST